MAMLVVAEFAHGEGVGAIGRRAATEADGLGVGAQALFALAGLVMVGLSIFEIKKYNKTDGAQGKLSMAAILLFGGSALLYIASSIDTGSDTIWGEGGGDKSRVTIQR
ncbi:hypothetical protein APB34_10430 [Pseudomonas aeruginosa]|uniref:Uncharacterized protein n=3 Tax=Pseudomonas TaxID=286 RepID=A0A367M493_PSEAI|nr:hypothetical protein YH69_33950 [Pseudomonas aeruginosa]AXZ89182.1 hypothetical protein AM490_00670 [Pseudomonas aeruginosa]AZM87092.1 hypothetical protein EIP87_33575 [Pseudomonas aeruginosa]EIU2680033.1 hypothetical protein [Pseudomonas aeruginosa]EIY2510268.1 hypothetical protein [Pseudomonas aeruginosa]